MAKFKNLVFEGGGVWGIAYQGVLSELEAQGVVDLNKLERVGGASAGAISACLLAVGYKPDELGDILAKTDFREFQDDSTGLVRDVSRLLNEYGWYKGDVFSKWLQKHIRTKIRALSTQAGIRKPVLSPNFGELKAWHRKLARKGINLPALYVVGSNLSKQRHEVYSAERKHTPELKIDEAVRRSMSIPLFFACSRNKEKDVLVDGGLTWNYPVSLFDHKDYLSLKSNGKPISYAHSDKHVFNSETLGFRLDTPGEIATQQGNLANVGKDIDNILDYAVSLMTFVRAIASKSHLHENDFSRTVVVNIGDKIKFTDFKLTGEQQDFLVSAGEDGVKQYLKWYGSATGKRDLDRIYRDMAPG